MGSRFNKEAEKVAEGEPPRTLKNRKGRKVLRTERGINMPLGEVSLQGGLLDRNRVKLSKGVEEQARALRDTGREEGQGGGGGRRR